MNETLHSLFQRSLDAERKRGAKADALFEFALAVKQAGTVLADMGARLAERWNCDREPREWHLAQIRDAAAAAESAINAYELFEKAQS